MELNPHMTLADGTIISVQASGFHYCTPREDDAETYTSAEVMIIEGKPVKSWTEFDAGGVYAYVSLKRIYSLIQRRGGIKKGSLPLCFPCNRNLSPKG